jgi:rRNA maturation endonuclease Nob1
MAKTIPMQKRGSPLLHPGDRPQGPPWRCAGCRYIVTQGDKPYCRICRSKGLGTQEERDGCA